jgi:superfamily I DNA/RNA helicase/mRNA-degrading endonuclease RelE of RelBE toxin-antitoxin system
MLVYDLVHKPTFTNQLLALPPKVIPQILEKVELLRVSPAPDAKNKKRLRGYKGDVYRIRAGDFRILYTFGKDWVALLGVDDRKDVYKGDDLIVEGIAFPVAGIPATDGLLQPVEAIRLSAMFPGAISVPTDAPEPTPGPPLRTPRAAMTPATAPPSVPTALSRRLDVALLRQLRISIEYFGVLLRCQTVEDLIAAPVPEAVRGVVFDAVTTPNYDGVLTQPSYRVESADDYRRFLEGEFLEFLLKLDPEQERDVTWSIRRTGPCLLKGAPGTGKSIVAVYRAKSLIAALRQSGTPQPRILFTSYTNALVRSLRQFLRRLLGPDERLVDVRTADSLVAMILESAGVKYRPIDDGLARAAVQYGRRLLSGGSSEDQALARSIALLSLDYLTEEIDKVIVAREHDERADYLADQRVGRRVPLTATQRTAVWRVHEAREAALTMQHQETFAQSRREAIRLLRTGRVSTEYDGVIVDEAQDLDPTVIRLLVGLCRASDRLFLTADPNQCIYGSGFRWRDVHDDLRFRGRTGVLRRNYRSTWQIAEAAAAYLVGAEVDEQEGQVVTHLRSGPRPVAVPIHYHDEQIDLLHRYILETTRELRVGLGACAMLVPNKAIGTVIAADLRALKIHSEFMPGSAADLERPSVKVITFHSAKGLEFPVVALAGLLSESPFRPKNGAAEENDEAMRIARRILYVAMTRSMHTLLALIPAEEVSPLFDGLNGRYWHIGLPKHWSAWLQETGADLETRNEEKPVMNLVAV